MKIACRSTLDMISELPSSIAENILMFLPLQDAARTSILSKNWRYRWERLPQLVFDHKFDPKSLKHPRDIVMKIYEILLLHPGPIFKFTLNISNLRSCSEIGKMIRFLSRNGIQEFTLIMSGEGYKLPSYMFSCPELRHLYLHNCEIDPPRTFKGFSKLISLELWETALPPHVSLSNCPLLELLKLQSSTVIESLSIDAPHMKLIWIIGIIKSIGFINTPLLEELSFAVDGESPGEQTFDSIKVFGCLPHIERLHMDYTSLRSLAIDNVPKKLPTLLNSLRHLELNAICFTEMDDLSRTLCLIRSSPNLQKLWIEVSEGSQKYEEPSLKYLEMQDYSDVSLDRLCEVHLHRHITGLRPELEFIKFLLAKSPALEKMHIRRDARKIDKNYVNMLIEVTRFQRASQKAEIIFPRLNSYKP